MNIPNYSMKPETFEKLKADLIFLANNPERIAEYYKPYTLYQGAEAPATRPTPEVANHA